MKIQQNNTTLTTQGPTTRFDINGIDSRFERLKPNSKNLKTNIVLVITGVLLIAIIIQPFLPR